MTTTWEPTQPRGETFIAGPGGFFELPFDVFQIRLPQPELGFFGSRSFRTVFEVTLRFEGRELKGYGPVHGIHEKEAPLYVFLSFCEIGGG